MAIVAIQINVKQGDVECFRVNQRERPYLKILWLPAAPPIKEK